MAKMLYIESVISANQASRLNQEVRHCEKDLYAFLGLPRWKVEAIRPPTEKP